VQSGPEVESPNGVRGWLSTFAGPVEYDVTELSVTSDRDLAFGHSVNRLSATPVGADRPFEMWFRSTLCLRRGDTGWRVADEHNSTPFYMDGSFRAAIDLRP
jgi:ketosteroid isomerase-like protein